MRRFTARMFPNTVTIRKATSVTSVQGGANPVPAMGQRYQASVQPLKTKPVSVGMAPDAAMTGIDYDVFLDRNPNAPDPYIASLAQGDEIDTDEGVTLRIKSKAKTRGGYGVLWWLECEAVQ